MKLLVTSNFSFSHNVFYSYISLVCQNAVLCGNGLMLFPTVFQLYRSGQCIFPCFHCSAVNNILSKRLTAFPHNHCWIDQELNQYMMPYIYILSIRQTSILHYQKQQNGKWNLFLTTKPVPVLLNFETEYRCLRKLQEENEVLKQQVRFKF